MAVCDASYMEACGDLDACTEQLAVSTFASFPLSKFMLVQEACLSRRRKLLGQAAQIEQWAYPFMVLIAVSLVVRMVTVRKEKSFEGNPSLSSISWRTSVFS